MHRVVCFPSREGRGRSKPAHKPKLFAGSMRLSSVTNILALLGRRVGFAGAWRRIAIPGLICVSWVLLQLQRSTPSTPRCIAAAPQGLSWPLALRSRASRARATRAKARAIVAEKKR